MIVNAFVGKDEYELQCQATPSGLTQIEAACQEMLATLTTQSLRSLTEADMSVEDPVIITCSISGAIANRDQCPAIPYTPEEYAAEARRIVDEGGVHIHIHARRPTAPRATRSRTSWPSATRSAPPSATP